MDIKYAILGFLSWKPMSGYDLKKVMTSSTSCYWTGNNNQIYTSLIQLQKEGLVSSEIQNQERLPVRKEYTVTEKGFEIFRAWLLSPPEAPVLRNFFLVQLAWGDRLDASELRNLLISYENEIKTQLMMLNETKKRGLLINPARTDREKYLWDQVTENQIGFYENEFRWAQETREELDKSYS